MKLLSELSEKHNNDDFTNEECEKMKEWQKILDETIEEIKTSTYKK